MRYRIEVNEVQLELIEKALDEYLRLRLGQFSGLAHSLAFDGLDYTRKDKSGDVIGFDARMERRNNLEVIFKAAAQIAYNTPYGGPARKPDCWGTCIDLCHVIEHQQWLDSPSDRREAPWTSSRSGYQIPLGPEPFPKIERVDE